MNLSESQQIIVTIIFFILVIFLIIFLTIYFKRKGRKMFARFSNLPEFSIKVKIVAKNVVVREEIAQISENNFQTVERDFCNLTFETNDNIQWNFDVSAELYNAAAEGDTGTLVYKEQNLNQYFVSFTRTV
jgi:hypothetical protein